MATAFDRGNAHADALAAEDLPLLRNKAVDVPSEDAPSYSPYVVVVSLTAAISGLCFGFEIGIIDTVLAMSSFREYFGTFAYDSGGVLQPAPDRDHTEGWIVSCFLLGAMAGSILVSELADRAGRRVTLMVGSAIFCFGGLLQTLATSLFMLYAGRVCSGAGVGILSMCAPLYVSESAPAHLRGRLVACVQLLITVGILLASVVNSVMYVAGSGESQWRGALGAQVVPGVALACLLCLMPESPRWLMAAGRQEEATVVLARLRGKGVDHPSIQAEVAAMHKQVEVDNVSAGVGREGGLCGGMRAVARAWGPLLSGPALRRLAIACALQLFQQCTGINVVLYYSSRLFEELGVPQVHAATSLVAANAALLVLGTVPGILLVDRPSVGRRKLLMLGAGLMAIFHACIVIAVLCVGPIGDGQVSTANAAAGWFAVACMLLFTTSFSATWGPVVWVVQSEIFATPGERAKGGALATLTNWTSNAIIGKVAPLMLSILGPWTYAGFAVMCAAMCAFVAVFVPETGGRTLEEMGDILT